MNNKLSGHLQVIFATFLIAGSFIATADISAQLHPLSLNLMRFAIATMLMVPFVVFKKGNLTKLLRVIPRSLVISFFYCGYFACNFIAMLSTSTINVGSIYTLTPLVTALFSIIIFKQPLTLKSLLIYGLGMLGTLWVVFGGDMTKLSLFDLNNGDVIFSLGVLCMSGYTIAMKLLYRNDDVQVMTFTNLLGGVFWMLLATVVMQVPLEWRSLDSSYYPSMLYLAIAATFLTSYLYQKASTILKPVNVSAYIYLNPLCVALLSLLLFGEMTSGLIWIGIGISTFATFYLHFADYRAST
ncbi:DMT family transporter [Vibrio alginolyticus]|uniref:DMT family transporter n=1 Tax=Vibrio alginolyticus TaxID=663 RepID=UPI003D7E02CC